MFSDARSLVCCALFWLCCAPTKGFQDSDRTLELRTRIQPLLQEHCLDCHAGGEPDAGLTLDHFDTPLSFLKGRSVWEKAIQKLQIEEMPPPEISELSASDRKYLIEWINSTIEDVECGLAPNPGKVTLRRLNAAEYRNTIRDLFGLQSYKPASAFPGDDVGYGFDNIGDVLTLPPLLLEKYFLEAERISRALIQTPPPDKVLLQEYSGSSLQVNENRGNGRELVLVSSSDDDVGAFSEQLTWAGVYQLTITASGDQVGREPCQMSIAVDGKQVRRIAVPNPRNQPRDYSIPLRLRAGKRDFTIRFTNDFYDPGTGGGPKLDRNLVVHHVRLQGRKASGNRMRPEQLSKFHRRIIFKTPQHDREREQVTTQVIANIASRAFRRPVEEHDLQRLVALAMEVQNDGDSFEEGIQVALQAILISPQFLFRVEPPSAGYEFNDYRDLDQFELATRLSYFLWSSMPDDRLLRLAVDGKLRSEDVLRNEIIRMVQDKKADALVSNFAGQWLTLRKLKDFHPAPSVFPKWNKRIASLAEYETFYFFAGILRKDMSILRLLDADFTYLNEELASFYGIPDVKGSQFRQVTLAGTPRAGLLTQASVLAVTSNPTRTSPVKRGKWILDNLLDKPPPPAPAGVPELAEQKTQLVGTLRERLEQHRANPACANCHKLMDPLGFALENFDAIGQYRTHEGRLPVDSAGELPDGSLVSGALQLQRVLVDRHREDFVRSLTEKLLTYAIGRGLEYYDKCAIDKIVAALEKDDYRFSTLLVEIVSSDPFQKKGEREIR